MTKTKYSDLDCYVHCPYNKHGHDISTGYPFIPCSDYHKEICDILKKSINKKENNHV